MTINSEIRKVGPFIGNGTASAFPFTFKVFQASDLEVVRLEVSTNVETVLTLNSQYTVTLNVDQDSNPGGTVTLIGGALASGYTLTLTSDVPYLQPTDLTNQGGFYPDVINDALDRATIQIQQLGVDVNRSLKVPVSSTVSTELPNPSANELLGWDSTGTSLTNVDPSTLATVVAYATAYADVFIGDGVTTSFVLTRPAGSLYNLDVSIQGVTQEPVRDYTLSGTTITFTTAPFDTHRVLVKYKEGLQNYEGDSQDVRYLPAGTGAVARTVQSKLRESVSVLDFGADSTGVADSTAAIQNACNSGAKAIYFGDNTKSYKINGTITVPTGTTLYGEYPTITQTAVHTILFDVSNTDSVSVYGLNLVGVGTDFIDSDSTNPAIAINANLTTKLRVFNNNFTNFSYTTVKANNSTDFQFLNNIVVGPGTPILTPITDGRNYGLLVQLSTRSLIDGNTISKCAQGLRIELADDVVMSNNIIYDIVGQHGIYSGAGVDNQNISNNIIYNCQLIGIKCQASVASGVNVDNVVISGNNITNVGDQGILLCCGDGTRKAIRVMHATIDGNTVKGCGATGINVQNVTNGVVTSNAVYGAQNGININACDYVVVDGNTVIGAQHNGITDQYGSTNLIISNNRIHNVATANLPGYEFGIFFGDSTGVMIDGNFVSDNYANMQYGVYIAKNQTSFAVTNNYLIDATDYAIRLENNTDSMLAYHNNFLNGTLGVAYNGPALKSVASASTISVPTNVSVVKVTGTTGITSIRATGQTGQKITLVFADALTVTDGSNLKLAGNFTSTADDCLTLVCDGTNWYEVSRSVN